MLGRTRFGTVKVLLATLFGGALLLGPLSPPAAAGPITTECTLQAQNTPTTDGQDATFRFFAAARSPEDSPPSPSGIVTFFDGLGGTILGTAVLPLDLEQGQLLRRVLHGRPLCG